MLTVNATLEAELVAPRKGRTGEESFVHPPLLRNLVIRRLPLAAPDTKPLARLIVQGQECGTQDTVAGRDEGEPILTVLRIMESDLSFRFGARAVELITAAGLASIEMLNVAEGRTSFEPNALTILTGNTEAVVELASLFSARPLRKSHVWAGATVDRLDELAGQTPTPRYVLPSAAFRIASRSILTTLSSRLQAQTLNRWTGQEEAFLVQHNLPWLSILISELEALDIFQDILGAQGIPMIKRRGANVNIDR